MKNLILIMIILASKPSAIIFEFNQESDLRNWIIVDDVVMGGKSFGSFELDSQGHGVFEGVVSLENNGGFSSVRYKFNRMQVGSFTKINLRVKGDGKKYQFRIKNSSADYYSYISTFSTSGGWENIEIPLSKMYPSFRGRKINKPNFGEEYIEEIGFLIGNKNEETFKLQIDKIELM